MESLRSKKGFICDMDGVIYHGNQLLPGVKEFVEWLQKEEKQFLSPARETQFRYGISGLCGMATYDGI